MPKKIMVVNGDFINAWQSMAIQWTDNKDFLILNGTGGADTLTGWSRDDQIFGGSSNDIITENGGVDLLYGGEGDDIFC